MAKQKHSYPPILTKKDWLKKKGAIAKMAGKTGVGQAMDALEKSYNKVNWRIFDAGLALPHDREARDVEGCKMVIKNAQAEYKSTIKGTVLPNLKDLKKCVTDARDKFKKSKTIPKKAAEHAQKVLDAIKDIEDDVKLENLIAELRAGVEQVIKDKAEFDKFMKGLRGKLKQYVVALAKDAKTVRTKTEFISSWSENIRGIGTTLPQLSQELGLEAEHKRWRTYASQGWHPASDEEVVGKYAELAPDLKKIAQAISRG